MKTKTVTYQCDVCKKEKEIIEGEPQWTEHKWTEFRMPYMAQDDLLYKNYDLCFDCATKAHQALTTHVQNINIFKLKEIMRIGEVYQTIVAELSKEIPDFKSSIDKFMGFNLNYRDSDMYKCPSHKGAYVNTRNESSRVDIEIGYIDKNLYVVLRSNPYHSLSMNKALVYHEEKSIKTDKALKEMIRIFILRIFYIEVEIKNKNRTYSYVVKADNNEEALKQCKASSPHVFADCSCVINFYNGYHAEWTKEYNEKHNLPK